jgi:transposase
MLHVGLDLSRTRVDVHVMDEAGVPLAVTTAAPDAGGLASLVRRVGEFSRPVAAAIESMTGARFVHDELELRGSTVEIADAVLDQRPAQILRLLRLLRLLLGQ